MAGGDISGVGISGLLAFQRALATTSHNISNVNTEGYSRQRTELSTRLPQFSGAGYIGNGVQVDTVRRIYDEFVTQDVRAGTSSYSQLDTFYQLASQVDNLLADPQAGLMPGIEGFFNAVQDLANDPTSAAARQVLLSEAGALANRFQYIDQRLVDLDARVNSQIKADITSINNLAASIAQVNQDIVLTPGNQPPNDLLDRRDAMIAELSQYVSVKTVEQTDGAVNVFIGNGQTLVVGIQSQSLSAVSNQYDVQRIEVGYGTPPGTVNITQQIAGGSLGGLLEFRNQMIDPGRNALGQAAIGLSSDFNTQHKLGMDLKGALGGLFFADIASTTPRVLSSSSATVSAGIVDSNALTTSDYRLDRNGANYTLTRLSDNTVTDMAALGFPGNTVTVDGINFSVSAGVIADGDSFLIQPTREAASGFTTLITDTSRVAAAAPIRTQATFANTGSGVVSAGTVNSPDNRVTITFTAGNAFDVVDNTTGATLATNVVYGGGPQAVSFNGWTATISGAPVAGDTFVVDNTVTTDNSAGSISVATVNVAGSDPNLTDAVTITFNNPANTFDVTGSTTGSPTVNVPYTAGMPISFNGWTINIDGTPAAGDSFTIGPNAGGASDNRNALLLGNLQTELKMNNDASSYQAAYSQFVSNVGAQTHSADVNRESRSILLDQAIAQRESISGVNLDEEAANLVRYQQAYEAAAQVIATADSLFDTLIGILRR